MYTKKELEKIKRALPKDGYVLISAKLVGKSPDAVRMILNHPDRYQSEVFDAVVEVMKEHKAKVSEQKSKVMEAIK